MSGQGCKWDPRVRDLLTAARYHRQVRKQSRIARYSGLFLPGVIAAQLSGRVSFRIGNAMIIANQRMIALFASTAPLELEYIYRYLRVFHALRRVSEDSHEDALERFWGSVTQLDKGTENPYTKFSLGCSCGRLFYLLAQSTEPMAISVLQCAGQQLSELQGTTPLTADLREAGSVLGSHAYSHSSPNSRTQQVEALGWWLAIRAVRRYMDEIAGRNTINNPEHIVMFLWHRMLRLLIQKGKRRQAFVQSLEIEPLSEGGASIVQALDRSEGEFLALAARNDLAPEEFEEAFRKIHQVTLAPAWRDYFGSHVEAKRWRRMRKQPAN